MPMRHAERRIARLGIPILLVASCDGGAAVSWHATKSEIRGFAPDSHFVLAVQVALLFFYGALLLLVPLVRAFFDGDLPIELSLRGARWREEVFGIGDEFLISQATAHRSGLGADSRLGEGGW
jgi:hypothetical protein